MRRGGRERRSEAVRGGGTVEEKRIWATMEGQSRRQAIIEAK